jgi:hypothetical protein
MFCANPQRTNVLELPYSPFQNVSEGRIKEASLPCRERILGLGIDYKISD